LPIAPDYLGESIVTARGDHVRVCFTETDGRDGVFLTATEESA
jgi:pyrimidine operon attenuation protein/uracil phosphoribosyltransferase